MVANDTYDKYVSVQAELHKRQSMWEHLDPHMLSIATVDNFDKQSRHAMVNCGSKSRSYHGTTIMIVQPHLGVTSESLEESPPPANGRKTSEVTSGPAKEKDTTIMIAQPHLSGTSEPPDESPPPAKRMKLHQAKKSTRNCQLMVSRNPKQKQKKKTSLKILRYLYAQICTQQYQPTQTATRHSDQQTCG